MLIKINCLVLMKIGIGFISFNVATPCLAKASVRYVGKDWLVKMDCYACLLDVLIRLHKQVCLNLRLQKVWNHD